MTTITTADDLFFPDSPTLHYLNELIKGFAHKHNNVLTVTQGYSQLLIAENHSESVNKCAKTIEASARKAFELNSRMMACTSADPPQLKEVDFSIYLKGRCVQENKSASSQIIDFELDSLSSNSSVKTDPIWLDSILSEVINNAREAIKESSSPKIAVNTAHSSPLESDPKLFQFLEVRDNGHGIPEEKLGEVFKPFFTDKGREHVGIGLTRAGVMAGKSGIRIGISSSLEGTVVYFAIPVS